MLSKEKNNYPELFRQIFNKECKEIPAVVNYGFRKDGTPTGFLAGHWELEDTFYIEYAGILPEFQKKGWVRYIKKLIDPCINYLTAVENTNVETGRILYAIGFIPIGCRYHDDTFYIEWLKRGVQNG